MPTTTEHPTITGVRSALPKPVAGVGPRYATWALYEVERLARHGDVPFRAGYAAQAIAWSIETGRLLTAAHRTITRLDRAGLARLVVEVARSCEVAGDVPYWLNARYGRTPS